MAKIDPALRRAWKADPDKNVNLVLKLEGDMGDRIEALEDLGVRVRRRYRLTGSLAVKCKASVALTLSRRRWITKIESDRPLGGFGR